MGMVVQHNMNAINAYNRLNANVAGLRKASEKLSSGYRINKAGDDAAGLAISEKMRSQIRGLNQAVRNSQDGINMIQTFEGAAQETHSILQRMKELAAESANGTYDNATDRAAIQLEFEQLNDELNQIADTDFNGTVVLNGGEMADGLKQVDGNFDYRMKADQVAEENAKLLANAQAEAQKKIDAAQKAFDSAKAQYDATTGRDLCLDGNAVQWNTVDDNAYTSAVAKDLFDNAEADDNGTATSLTDLGVDSFEVTFKYTEPTGGATTGTWAVDKAWYVNDDGEEVEVDLAKTKLLDASITATANGGFSISSTGTAGDNSALGNAIFAASNAKTGDVVTLTYTNTASASFAPTNIGMDEETLKDGVGLSAAPKLTLDAGVTDAAIANDASLMDALTKLDKASVDFQYSTAGITGTISDDSLILTQEDPTKGVFTISYNNPDGKEIKLATITMDDPQAKSTATGKAPTWSNNGSGGVVNAGSETYTFDGTDWKDAAGNTATAVKNAANVEIVADITTAVQGTAVAGDSMTISWNQTANGDAFTGSVDYTGTEGTVGKVSFGIALDEGNYDVSNTKPTIDPSTSPDGTDATAIDKAYEDTKAALAAAKAAMPKTIEDLGDLGGVTKADAFDNSTARMTYTDNLTLQTGARTKDAVNFTFKYNTEDTADMGNLKANLNLSARADGLNTANLSLANQKDANYAIDQIDKAINKTSMVRATFGAIQNRLEHKITNLTTTSENLTEAESSIRDTDMASEMMNYTKFNILQQAAQSMLAQANQQPQSILQLLG